MKEKGIRREQTQDRAVWRRLVQYIDPTRSGIRRRTELCGGDSSNTSTPHEAGLDAGPSSAEATRPTHRPHTKRDQTQDRAVRRRLVQHIDPTRSGIRRRTELCGGDSSNTSTPHEAGLDAGPSSAEATRPTHRPHTKRDQTQDRAVWRRLVQYIDPTRSGIRHKTELCGGDSSNTSTPREAGLDAGPSCAEATRPTHRPHVKRD